MATLVARVSDLVVAIRDKFNAIAPRLLPVGGTAGQIPTKTVEGVEWADAPSGGASLPIRVRSVVLFADIFEGSTADGFTPTSNAGSFTNSLATVTNTILGQRYGVTMLLSGSAANSGYSYAAVGSNKFLSNGGEIFRAAVYVPAATLADSSFRVGFNTQWNNTDTNNETVIKVVAGAVTGRTNDNGTTTVATVGTLAGDTWYILELVFNVDATSVACNIRAANFDLLATATMSSNISKTTRRNVGVSTSSTTAGAKSIVALDYIYAEIPTNRSGD
jgi:hypothetical protein